MKTLQTFMALLVFVTSAFSQRDPCDPQCNIYFNDILRMRCPDEEIVFKLNNLAVSEYGYNPDFVKIGGPLCGDKAAALLKKYREEDRIMEKVLRGRYCSAQQGWVLKEGESCVHGNPRPCCTAPEESYPWKKIDAVEAILQFKKDQDKIYQQRLRELADIVKPCKIQTVNDNNLDFDNSYEVAIDLINKFRDEYPSQSPSVQNSHRSKISTLKQQYDAEASKQEKADIQKLNQLVKSIKQEKEALSKLSEHAAKEKTKNIENEKIAKEKVEKEKAKITEDKKKSESSKSNLTDKAEQEARRRKAEVDAYVAEMSRRRQEQHTKDSIENVHMGVAALATAGAMLAMGDKESRRKEEDYEIGTYLKAVLGLGFNSLPVIENSINSGVYLSIPSTTMFPVVEGSLQFAAFNRSFISWKFSPYGYFGMNALDAGTTGTHFCYGGSTSLGLGKSFKVLLQGEYLVRNGTMSMDNAINFIDSKGTANYSYSTLKYGPGIQLRIGDDAPSEYSISAFREQLSFMKGQKKQVYSFQFKWLAKIVHFMAEYSPDYPVAGDILFPATYTKDKQYLMKFGISVPLTLFSE